MQARKKEYFGSFLQKRTFFFLLVFPQWYLHRVKSLALLAALAFPNLAVAACNAPPVADLPMSESENKLLIPVGIDGSPEQIALDTGAGITVVSTETANRLEISHDFDHHMEVGGVGGANSILYIGRVNSFDLGPLHLQHQNFPIVDLPMRTASGLPIAGFLGADILHVFDIEIDIQRGRLALWPAAICAGAAPAWADGLTPLSIDLDEGNHILVPLRINGATLNAVLDTGANGLTLTTRAAFRTGLSDDTLDEDPELHGTGVNNRVWKGHWHRYEKITVAGVSFTNVPAGIVPSSDIASYNGLGGADALLGVNILRHTRLFISYRTRTLYLQPLEQHAPD
jgi:predicted aspartyl protease